MSMPDTIEDIELAQMKWVNELLMAKSRSNKHPKKDRLMKADDLFLDGVKQVFSVRTGNFVGYEGDHLPEGVVEEEIKVEPMDPSQLELFNL